MKEKECLFHSFFNIRFLLGIHKVSARSHTQSWSRYWGLPPGAAELNSRGPFHSQKNLASLRLKYAFLIRGTMHWGIHTCVKYRLELAEPQHALMNLLPNFIYQERCLLDCLGNDIWLNRILHGRPNLTAIKLQNKSANRNQIGLDLSQRHFHKHLISVSDTLVYSS